MNRCLVVTLIVLLVTSGVTEVNEAVDSLIEDSGTFIASVQDGSIFQSPVWDNLMCWWGSEEVGAIRKRKKPLGSKIILKPKGRE